MSGITVVRLFAPPKFRIHRLWGLLYLLQFAAACAFEATSIHPVHLVWTLPLTGFIQAIIACLTFTSLPRRQTQGYFADRGVMSYEFILENVYFSGLLLFQALYFTFRPLPLLLLPVEIVLVFFPYHIIRPFFPKTSFRKSYGNERERSPENAGILGLMARTTKVFYISAKHFNGYFINYLLFLALISSEQDRLMRCLFILAGWGTTIAMFLQTLKIKKYISSKTSLLAYMGVFPFLYLGYSMLFPVAFRHPWISGLAAVGLAANFGPRWVQITWQCVVCGACLYVRF
ncbi:MAG: hypothetical protein EXR72_17730 [Myxococcales bacterium]|nr:hypothetical protein [Myxococcales bacterium]